MTGEAFGALRRGPRSYLSPRGASGSLSRNVALLLLAVTFGALAWLFWPAISGAVQVWYGNATYNHGFLILPVVLYLVWERRESLRDLQPTPCWWALPGVVLGSLAWLVAHAVGVQEGQQLALMVSVQFILLAVLGVEIYRRLLFPLLFLFFLVPSGEFLVPSLQDFTARFTVIWLRLVGVPVFSDGVFLSIPGADFHVAEACAGLRFLVATIAFGFLFADLAYTSWVKRACFVALCLVVPVIANGFRAFGIVMIAYLSSSNVAGLVDHIVYGWFFFSAVTLGLIAVGWLFRDKRARPTLRSMSMGGPVSGPLPIVLAGIAALILIAAPRAYAAYVERSAGTVAVRTIQPPVAQAPWMAAAAGRTSERWKPDFPKADARLMQTYSAGQGAVDLFVAYYGNQTDQKRLIAFENRAYDARWDMVERSRVTLPVDGREVVVNVTRLRAAGQNRVVYSWYWANRQYAANPMTVKLLQARAAFIDRQPEAAFIALATDTNDIGDNPLARVRDLLGHLERLDRIWTSPGSQ
jgi:exosortase A